MIIVHKFKFTICYMNCEEIHGYRDAKTMTTEQAEGLAYNLYCPCYKPLFIYLARMSNISISVSVKVKWFLFFAVKE
jgi:hypothetical protein